MLTKEAFNALLKTMEEPPEHVKFILCTTEAHKVPATIQSRCQRFDFRALPAARIAEQLRLILAEEQIEADDEVVRQVARLGNGSMRDALSLLDRLLASGEARLGVELLEQMLGLPDQAIVHALVDAIIAGDAAAVLTQAEVLLSGGATVEQTLELLAQHFRTLMVASACGADSDLIDLSPDAIERAVQQASAFDLAGLVHAIALCEATARNARGSAAARALLDAVLVRLALAASFADVNQLIADGVPPQSAEPKKKRLAPPGPDVTSERSAPVGPAGLTARDSSRAASPSPAIPTAGRDLDTGSSRTDTRPDSNAKAPAAESAAPTVPVTSDRLWPAVLERATPAERRRLEYLVFSGVDGDAVRLTLPEEAASVARMMEATRGRLEELIREVAGKRMRVEMDTAAATPRQAEVTTSDLDDAAEDPVIREAIELFDATVVRVEPRPDAARAASKPD